MDAKKFFEEWQRMCESHKDACTSCLAFAYCQCYSYIPSSGDGVLDGSMSIDNLLEMVEQWAEEHPKKTRLDDFKGKYPNAPLDESGIPTLMPWSLGYCGDTPCYACKKGEGKTLAWCWNQEVEESEARDE